MSNCINKIQNFEVQYQLTEVSDLVNFIDVLKYLGEQYRYCLRSAYFNKVFIYISVDDLFEEVKLSPNNSNNCEYTLKLSNRVDKLVEIAKLMKYIVNNPYIIILTNVHHFNGYRPLKFNKCCLTEKHKQLLFDKLEIWFGTINQYIGFIKNRNVLLLGKECSYQKVSNNWLSFVSNDQLGSYICQNKNCYHYEDINMSTGLYFLSHMSGILGLKPEINLLEKDYPVSIWIMKYNDLDADFKGLRFLVNKSKRHKCFREAHLELNSIVTYINQIV